MATSSVERDMVFNAFINVSKDPAFSLPIPRAILCKEAVEYLMILFDGERCDEFTKFSQRWVEMLLKIVSLLHI